MVSEMKEGVRRSYVTGTRTWSRARSPVVVPPCPDTRIVVGVVDGRIDEATSQPTGQPTNVGHAGGRA
ncbi:MAG: hypothetical protein M3P26_08680, partial [Gemmatimonadota bacterium]|nr:hypothetical protein [Gemmatimonadota bacterium]